MSDVSEYCYAHDPARAEDRTRAATKGGKSGGKGRPASGEITKLKDDVREVIANVESGDLDRNDAAVMLQGYRVLKDLVELERRAKTTDELAAQIAELRERIEGGRRAAF